jgi:hypothetical protein
MDKRWNILLFLLTICSFISLVILLYISYNLWSEHCFYSIIIIISSYIITTLFIVICKFKNKINSLNIDNEYYLSYALEMEKINNNYINKINNLNESNELLISIIEKYNIDNIN